METKRLRLFALLAEELHFGRAARRAGVAQSVLSVQIKRLEDEVGAELLVRTRRDVRLSEIGQRFVFEARAVLDRLEQARRVATTLKSGKDQVLRVAMTTVAMLGKAPQVIGRFRDTHPQIEVEIRELGTVDQENALADRDIDLGFLHPPLDRAEMEIIPLPTSRFLVLRRRRPRDVAEPTRWADLVRNPIIFYGRRRAPRLYDAFISSAHALGIAPEIAAEARSFLSAVGAASAGIGSALVPEEMRVCAPSNVEIVDPHDCPLRLQNGAAYRSDHSSPTLACLIAFIRDALDGAEGSPDRG